MPQHYDIADKLIEAFKSCIEKIHLNPELYESESKAVYGMMADIPDEAVTEEFLAFFMDEIYRYRE